MWQARARLLIATAWVGGLWGVGYLVAPTLFATLPDRALAGTIAGSLFRTVSWFGMFCGLMLIALIATAKADYAPAAKKILLLLIAGMLICILIGYFGLQPWMAALREAAGPGGVLASEARTQFGVLHGVSNLFFLVQSALGALLILKIRQ